MTTIKQPGGADFGFVVRIWHFRGAQVPATSGISNLLRLRAWQAFLRPVLPDGLALLALLLLTLIFFWPVTLHLGWIPSGGGDLVSLLWPHYSYAAQSLHAGRIPLWNPTLRAGAPFAADNQTSLFYPFILLACLLAPSMPYEVVEWLVVLHTWLAGASMYWLMRVLLAESQPASPPVHPHLPRLAALFSAVAFMFSDVFVTHIGNLNMNAVCAWLPAVFAALHLGLTRHSVGWAIGAGVLFGLSTLAGMAQMSLILALGLGAYALWRIVWADRQRLRLVALTGVTAAVAFGVTAITIVPTLELIPMTARVRLDYAAATAYSIPWPALAGLFSPLIFGRGPAGFWGPWERVEIGYLGVLPLLFAGLAPFNDRRRVAVFMAVLGILALLVAMGRNAPLHRLLYLTVPTLAGMRVPARFVLLTDFALAVLAGLGLQHLAAVSRTRLGLWSAALLSLALMAMILGYRYAIAKTGTSHETAWRTGLALSVGLLLGGIVLALLRDRFLAAALAVIVVAADLIGHGAWVEVERNDPTVGFQHPAAIEFLRTRPGPTRMDSAAGAWSPSASARYGLESIGGTHHALVLAAYQTYLDAVGRRGSPQYNFLNAQFVVADKGQPPGDETFVPVFDQDPMVDVYLNTNAMPRLNIVYSATLVSSGEAAFAAIHAPGFDPQETVVIEDMAAPAGTADMPAEPSNLYYLDYAAESFTVVAQVPAPAYLVLSEVWYPGWRAWVDDVAAPIYRANFAFRAVYLASAGEHVVEMRFEPASWRIGAIITAITVLALTGLAVRRMRRSR